VDAGELATVDRGEPALAREIVCQQEHACLVARIARSIVPDRRFADDAYAAGLLHDIGKLVVLGQPVTALVHAALGAYMLGIWGLPAGIVSAVAGHHSWGPATETNLLAAVTHTAIALAHEYEGDDDCRAREALDERIVGIDGMSPLVASWRAIVTEGRAVLSELPS
jgi:HD-like signal output (HDOD) protein